MVLLTLRFFAIGSMLQAVGDFFGIDKSTASRTVYKVACAIASLSSRYITMPERNEELRYAQQKFFSISRFPKCIGALDCTHIKIQSPGGHQAETFKDCICDAELKFQNVVCRWPGATHDAQIFRNSVIKRKFANNGFRGSLLLGDSGYAIKPYLLTPLLKPRTPAEHLYNESQIRTRNVIERCFGVWKRRFPILALGIRLDHRKVEAVVVATAVLHNIAQTRGDPDPVTNDEVLEALNLVADVPIQRNNRNINGINNRIRHALITEYFANLA
nr:unnamed protein product [Callosobruchus chinensis]